MSQGKEAYFENYEIAAERHFAYSIDNGRDDCGGTGPDVGCDGVCFSGTTEDCSGVCGGETVEDCAGVCGGDSVIGGCDNVCGSTAVADECGVCGGDNSTCTESTSGCTESTACNFNTEATVDDGSCEYTSCIEYPVNSLWFTSEGEDIWSIYYNANIEIEGFQFKIEGAEIIEYFDGVALDNGFSIALPLADLGV